MGLLLVWAEPEWLKGVHEPATAWKSSGELAKSQNTPSEEAGSEFDPSLSKAGASLFIDALQKKDRVQRVHYGCAASHSIISVALRSGGNTG